MSLRSLALAAVLAFSGFSSPGTSWAAKPERLPELPPESRQEPLSLEFIVKNGLASTANETYGSYAIQVMIDRFTVEIGFNPEREDRIEDGTFSIQGLELKGERHSRHYQVKFGFGYAPLSWEFHRPYLRLIPSLQLTGGMDAQLRSLVLEDGKKLPDTPALDFFFGVGGAIRIMYPLAHLTKLPVAKNVELGIVGVAEYRRRNITELAIEPDKNSYYLEGSVMLSYVVKVRR